MRKQLVVLFIVAASVAMAGVAGAQSPDPSDGTPPDTTETTLPADPDGDPDEDVPTTTESTTTTSTTTAPATTTTTSTASTTVAPAVVEDAPPPAEVAGLQQDGCHPSYDGACVPVGGGDVNCPSVPVKDFKVVGPDVYGLDGDNDGLACESGDESGDEAPVAASAGTTSSSAPDRLAATGGSAEQRYLLSLALVVAGLFAVLISAAVAPEITVPRRGGFTVTNVNRAGDEIRTHITTGDRAGRRSRR